MSLPNFRAAKAVAIICAVSVVSIAATFLQASLIRAALPYQAATSPEPVKNSSKPDDQPAPWTPAQSVDAAALAKELADSKAANPPKIVCVGFHTLYHGAHIVGASFHGPASTPQGLDDLKNWAKPLPRSADVVLYCGCCPLAHCPNVRPAFIALCDMGFTHLRVLILPHDFATDWVGPGYPVAKGE
jgi:thiosulfate/3-mercaptopyruvate sulfurtransferase